MGNPSKFASWFLFFALIGFNRSDSALEKPELHILGLFPMTNGGWLGGHAALLTAEMAIEHINNRTDILPNHTLKLHWKDSQCLAGPAINALFHLLYEPPVKHIVYGPGCSTTCMPTAEASHVWNITQIAYGCESIRLANKDVYKRFFRTITPFTSPARIEMMRVFNWKKIATIHQSYDLFSSGMDYMLEELDHDNVTVLLSEAFLGNPAQQVNNLKKYDARIIFGSFYPDAARKVMCEAYKKGLYGQKIVWFAAQWFHVDWWHDEGDTDCSTEQLQQVVDGMFYTGMTYVNPTDARGLAGISNTELAQLLTERTGGEDLVGNGLVASFYDGMWTVAMALDETVHKLREMGHPKPLEDFDYSDGDIGDVMTQAMRNVDFQGVLGPMRFALNGDPPRTIAIDQQQGDKRVRVGYYQPATSVQRENIFWVNGGVKWLGGRPPSDSSIIRKERQYVSESLYIVMCTLGSIGIAGTIFFFVFNLRFKNTRLIKMSSPNINNVILLGCLLGYCTVFLQERPGSDLSEDVLCVVRIYIFSVAFSLAFGALFSKTWRIHKILTMSSKLKKVVIKDMKLLGIVLGLVVVDLLILVLWQAVDPLTLNVKDLERKVSDVDPDLEIIPQLHSCSCDHQMYFTGALYIIQGMMLAFGAFLAWETRKVKVEALNDSKQIGVCIYNVLTLSVLGAAVTLVVEDNINVSYGFTSAIILIGTTLIQGIIFVPKVMGLKRGEAMVHATSQSSHESTVQSSENRHVITTVSFHAGHR